MGEVVVRMHRPGGVQQADSGPPLKRDSQRVLLLPTKKDKRAAALRQRFSGLLQLFRLHTKDGAPV